MGELANLYERISKDGTTQQPMAFWTQLRQAFPQFNEQVRPGAFGYPVWHASRLKWMGLSRGG